MRTARGSVGRARRTRAAHRHRLGGLDRADKLGGPRREYDCDRPRRGEHRRRSAHQTHRRGTGAPGRFADLACPTQRDDPADTAAAAIAAAVAQARAEHTQIVSRRAEAAALQRQRERQVEEQRVAAELARLLRSNNFPEWLEATALDALVEDASEKLDQLSNRQFALTHRDGEFFVIDHADADSLRSVRTLSGGETFQASLSLALALSAQLSSMAAAGAARLDSIFLDEGFGTLDANSLDVVAETLETLARSDRMVGIITHVPALADRVPVRFVVSRDDRSSRVEREEL